MGGGRQLVAAELPRRALHKSVRDHGEGSQNVLHEQSMIATQAAADVSLNLIYIYPTPTPLSFVEIVSTHLQTSPLDMISGESFENK